MASSSAITTRASAVELLATVTRAPLWSPPDGAPSLFARGHGGEELVLAALEVVHDLAERIARPHHGVGVARRFVVLLAGERGLRDEGPHARLVGRLLDNRQLLIEHGQLLPRPDQPGVDVSDPPLQEDAMHGASSVGGGEPATPRLELLQNRALWRVPDTRSGGHPDPSGAH